MKSQKGVFNLVIVIAAAVVIVIALAGWVVYKRSLSSSPRASNSSPAENMQPQNEDNKGLDITPPVQSSKYLEISSWGIKLKYTASGNYTLSYTTNDTYTLYLSTDQLDEFAKQYSECSKANRGTILNRIKPGGYDYKGDQWSESRLISVDAVKVGSYYYVKFPLQVCSTAMGGVSFDTQEEYIVLQQKIPFHDVVEPI